MTTEPDGPFTLVFVGHATDAQRDDAVTYEDAVLRLLDDHGARLLYRGRRATGQDPSLPLEVHLIWFPSRGALRSYLDDPRRAVLLQQHGAVFSQKAAVEMETIVGDGVRWPDAVARDRP